MRIGALDNLAIQFQHHPQHAMRRRVLGTEIDVEVADLLFADQHIGRAVVIAVGADIAVH